MNRKEARLEARLRALTRSTLLDVAKGRIRGVLALAEVPEHIRHELDVALDALARIEFKVRA